ncbi:MAG: glycoside hydrolase family 2 TIM barrel-domain containing protein [Spirochaetia bacterium]
MALHYLLDKNWNFTKKNYEIPPVKNHSDTYLATKAGLSRGPGAAFFDDQSWDKVNLPHDWVTFERFNPEGNLSAGYKDRGTGWYRRYFTLEENWNEKRIFLKFDGISGSSQIYVNGFLLKRHFSSYVGTEIEITEVANFGNSVNSIAVYVDAQTPEGWWYEGAGIYRHVWLTVAEKISFHSSGIHCIPEKKKEGNWSLKVEAEIESRFRETAEAEVEHQLCYQGDIVAKTRAPLSLSPFSKSISFSIIEGINPELWDIDSPNLYTVKSQVFMDDNVLDSEETQIGFRTFEFDAEKGFFLNGKAVKLKGTCNHQDHAGVGVALPDELLKWRIEQLKDMGSNAYRCAHNPPAKELLDECDRQGMLVIDELRKFGTDSQALAELEHTVKRDRNHPCIILWSIFNEEPIQGTITGEKIAHTMANYVHSLDSARPVTAGMNGGHLEEHSAVLPLDVAGINYFIHTYDEFHKLHPEKPVIGSETASTLSVRGEYKNNREDCILSAYDENAPQWGATAEDAWVPIKNRSFMAGTFVWTGFDYRGEPTPFSWPAVSSYFGIFDLAGFPKDNYYLYQCFWKDEPVTHIILPPKNDASPGLVIYSNCESVTIFLDDKHFGLFPVPENSKIIIHPESPFSSVKAEGQINEETVVTAEKQYPSAPESIRINAHKNEIYSNGKDIAVLNFSVVDADENLVTSFDKDARFTLWGPGRIIGVGNGNPVSRHSDKAESVPFFHGECQCIVQSTENSGDITISIETEELTAEIRITAIDTETTVPELPAAEPVRFLSNWRVSPYFTNKPLPNELTISDNDMNSWEPLQVNESTEKLYTKTGSWVCFLTKPDIPAETNNRERILVIESLVGEPEVRVNGLLCADYITDKYDRREVTDQNVRHTIHNAYRLPESLEGPFTITICFNAEKPAGITGRIFLDAL